MRTIRLSPTAMLPILLIPVVLLLVVMHLRSPKPSASTPAVEPPPEADYYLRGAQISTMGSDGKLLYRVIAKRVLHYPDQSIDLEDVDVDYLDGPWQLKALRGHIPPQQETLILQGDIDMSGQLRGGENVRLSTESITIRFDEQNISTQEAVSMSSNSVLATAIGMQTDLAGRELKLLSDVQVRYEP